MNIALFSPPPVGLNLVHDVTEGFLLDMCVKSRGLQGNYMCMLDKTSTTSNCNIFAERKGICNW